jgi:hypothetical protein
MLIMAKTASNASRSIQEVSQPPLAKNMPSELHAGLVDKPDLAAGFAVWLCSGKADWARGRYLSSNWDVDEPMRLKDQILHDDCWSIDCEQKRDKQARR